MTVPQLGFLDRSIFIAASGGIGSFTFANNVLGFQSPNAAGAVDQQQYGYAAQSGDLTQWEYGYGRWNHLTQTLTRATVLGNSLGGTSPINFNSPPSVLITLLAASMTQLLTGAFILATSNLIFYVNVVTGSDSNDGLTPATAFFSIQHALNVPTLYNFQNQFAVTASVADGTYTETLTVIPCLGISGDFVLLGNVNNPANVIIQNPTPGGGRGFAATGFGIWEVDGFYFKNFQKIITADNFASVFIDNCILEHGPNACASILSGNNRATFQLNGLGRATNGTTIQGTGAGTFLALFVGSTCTQLDGLEPLSFNGSNNFTTFVFFITDFSEATVGFSGSTAGVTGRRFDVSTFSLLNVTAADRTGIPGNAPGSIDTGAIIVQDPLYQIATPASGNTVTATPGCHQLILNPSGGLATLTVHLPIQMSDGETISISTTQTITALTVASTDGSTVVGSPTTLAASQHFCMMFDANNTTWYPSGSIFI